MDYTSLIIDRSDAHLENVSLPANMLHIRALEWSKAAGADGLISKSVCDRLMGTDAAPLIAELLDLVSPVFRWEHLGDERYHMPRLLVTNASAEYLARKREGARSRAARAFDNPDNKHHRTGKPVGRPKKSVTNPPEYSAGATVSEAVSVSGTDKGKDTVTSGGSARGRASRPRKKRAPATAAGPLPQVAPDQGIGHLTFAQWDELAAASAAESAGSDLGSILRATPAQIAFDEALALITPEQHQQLWEREEARHQPERDAADVADWLEAGRLKWSDDELAVTWAFDRSILSEWGGDRFEAAMAAAGWTKVDGPPYYHDGQR